MIYGIKSLCTLGSSSSSISGDGLLFLLSLS
jgi:hypothetical protein